MDLGNRDTRDLSPRLVCICVVIQEFIAQHQSNGKKPVFAAWLALDSRVEFLQSVNEKQREYDDILCNLSSREDSRDPFSESGGWDGIRGERLQRVVERRRALGSL